MSPKKQNNVLLLDMNAQKILQLLAFNLQPEPIPTTQLTELIPCVVPLLDRDICLPLS